MLDTMSASPRLIRRLAEGVERTRLVQPILSARPPLVVVSAPSGYGKTVLAAQIADSQSFARVIWIRNTGEAGTIGDVLAILFDSLTGSRVRADTPELHELCHLCSEELSELSSEDALLVVIDDASWAGDADACAVIEDVFAEAPCGTVALITTRAELSTDRASTRTWIVTADRLMFADVEIVEAWHRHAQRPLSATQAAEVAKTSGRHAALISLMARHSAFVGHDITTVERTPSMASMLRTLVRDQLSAEDRVLLDYASVLREGTLESLAICASHDNPLASLARISAAIPLVSVSPDGPRRRFVVHGLVEEACDSIERLAQRDPAGLCRVVDALAAAGATSRAVEVALEYGAADLLADCVRRFSARLVKGASWELIRSALDALPVEMVAGDPALLIARAEVAWIEGAKADAIRQATLAVRLGELSAGKRVPSAARSLLAGMRMSVADYSGAIADATPFLEAGDRSSADDLADALYAALPAYAFLGDGQGLKRCMRAASELVSSGGTTSSRLARLEMAMGLVTELALGDPKAASDLMYSAACRSDVPQHWRAIALSNCSACALESGDLERSATAHTEAAMAGSDFSTPVDRGLLALHAAMIEAISGGQSGIRMQLEAVVSACEAEGEVFTLMTTCSVGSQWSACVGDVDYANRLSERGIRAAADIGSPVLLWLAELVHAQVSLAVGDVERARLVAERVLPQVEAASLRGHTLHARMILARAALYEGDLAPAVQHLGAIGEYVIEQASALTVASYLRLFPEMFGPLALAIGVDSIPVRVLNLLGGRYGTNVMEQSASVLTSVELKRLSKRMRLEAERVAEQERVSDLSDAVCRVRLLGRLEVVVPHGPVGERDWGKRKARLLFAMLVARAGTDVPRGEIIEYLWPDMDESRAVNNFYVVWSAMKRALVPRTGRDTPFPYIEHVHEVCRVVPGRIVTDLDEFESHVVAARRAREQGDLGGELEAIRSAEQVYRGDLLPGDIYDDWFAPLRARTRHAFEDVMLRGAMILEERGNPHEGLALLRRSMSDDTLREDFYQALLRLQIAAGQRSEAIETYMSCRDRLVEELGIDPSRETTSLYEQILGMEEPCR